jgi:hypothetical protein
MWENNDYIGYHNAITDNVGQICNTQFSKDIEEYASNQNYKTFLEIGTWNGLGSTASFVKGFKSRTDDYVFYSLECNIDKSNDAAKLYSDNPKIHILNEVIWNEEPSDFYEIFPQCALNETYKHWNEIDIINMKKCNVFLKRTKLPEIFDVLLLDGREFTTYYEFKLLKDRCRILMLDDTNTDKCKLIVCELSSQTNKWKIVKQSNDRNGYVIAERL